MISILTSVKLYLIMGLTCHRPSVSDGQLPLLSPLTILHASPVVFSGASFCLRPNNLVFPLESFAETSGSCPHGSGCHRGFPAGHHAATSPRIIFHAFSVVQPPQLSGDSCQHSHSFNHCTSSTYSAPHTLLEARGMLRQMKCKSPPPPHPEQLADYQGAWQETDCVDSLPSVLDSTRSSFCFPMRSFAESCHPASSSFHSLSNFTTRLHLVIEAPQRAFSSTHPPFRLSSQGRVLLFESFILL
ncbi:uncharacterized protein LOC116569289 isoform X1 [Mustela erminea]|uniref:uncharacterized protein LOC116569289 isoform X1 n=1 Tax=Mustela erminea TaxID=36723 RepID=UPI0013875B1D|nr:uncharacterized protein LOC116569289 isoform X1 [Mustela erminea]XP_032161325.1 uncharacterized protein LOC116569289 isoform X1 [Mustela erminea]XP_032161326.1 uncharacterized protein LOC116569289 isoform X1 [Mustela erminea]